ncbi:MAG: ATP-binding cassette domain-containing protein, partial [Gammaproteobacteria bacterium]
LKLLLGFYQAQQGSIYYDDKDINLLDIYQLRSQFGVVLQNDQLMPNDIYTNIVGITNLTIEDAWHAAQSVGIAEDIKQMPMQMHTIIGGNESGLSGGQRQKVLLARAIVKKPKILFLDEAMSALDNISQAAVLKSINGLRMTKIIIAHRLSTIRNADMIYVLDDGLIVENGKYDTLINAQGFFAKLAHRQIIQDLEVV